MEIVPGSQVNVEMIRVPTTRAAAKTLTRLFRKDPAAVRDARHQHAKRPSWQEWRRGNATWHHQMRTRPPVRLAVGRTCRLRATVDVIRDLRSVERFVKVTPR
jgi:hypothetical protein